MTTNEELTRSKLQSVRIQSTNQNSDINGDDRESYKNGLKGVTLNPEQFFAIMNYLLQPNAYKSTTNGALKSVCSTLDKLLGKL